MGIGIENSQDEEWELEIETPIKACIAMYALIACMHALMLLLHFISLTDLAGLMVIGSS